MKKSLKVFLLLCFFVFGLSTIFYMLDRVPKFEDDDSEVLQATDFEDSVNVSAVIRLQEIRFRVFPEKRQPPINNWASHVDFWVTNSSGYTVFDRNLVPTDQYGLGVMEVDRTENISSGYYSVYVKGISHLTKRYDNIYFSKIAEYYDFTVGEDDLLAGDTHDSRDDYINSLDISTLINALNTGNYVNDLNQDSIVNSLDLSNQVFNISTAGDE
jgi:hypothetical protein